MDAMVIDETATDAICTEEFFHRTLVLERKRTERSGRPFLLVFIDIGDLLGDRVRPRDELVEDVASALVASTRDTDVKGWYRRDMLLGIICSEVTRATRDPVISKLKRRLSEHLDPQELKKIRIHLINYPDYEHRLDAASGKGVIPELQPERKGMFYS